MKNLATLRSMTYAIDKAKAEYWNAVKQNLIEVGKELRIVDEDQDEDLGYPDGLLLSVHNKHGILVDCVYNKVKTENGKVLFHQAYWDDSTDDYWQSSEDISYDNLIILCDYIEWQDTLKDAEGILPQMLILCSYDSDEQEFDEHLIVGIDVLTTDEGKERVRKVLNERFEYDTMDEDDQEEFDECVAELLKGEDGVGYFGIKYFWERQDVLM